MTRIYYNPALKEKARFLRNNSTFAEVLLWNQLKGNKIDGYDFHRQKPIGEYIVDFFCPKLMLAIEIDGITHEGKEKQDARRQKEIERQGVRFLRFYDRDVRTNMEGVIESIRNWIENNYEGTHP